MLPSGQPARRRMKIWDQCESGSRSHHRRLCWVSCWSQKVSGISSSTSPFWRGAAVPLEGASHGGRRVAGCGSQVSKGGCVGQLPWRCRFWSFWLLKNSVPADKGVLLASSSAECWRLLPTLRWLCSTQGAAWPVPCSTTTAGVWGTDAEGGDGYIGSFSWVWQG